MSDIDPKRMIPISVFRTLEFRATRALRRVEIGHASDADEPKRTISGELNMIDALATFVEGLNPPPIVKPPTYRITQKAGAQSGFYRAYDHFHFSFHIGRPRFAKVWNEMISLPDAKLSFKVEMTSYPFAHVMAAIASDAPPVVADPRRNAAILINAFNPVDVTIFVEA